MSTTRTRRVVLIGAVGAGLIGAAAASFSVAQAGHENAVLFAELAGANEVGEDGSTGVGDTDGSGESYVFGIDDDPTTLCYVITAQGIEPTFETGAAHIHRGAEGENGPIVAALAFPLGGDAGDCITEGEPDKFPLIGTEGEPEAIVADILANPANYYVNVHTAEFPDGAIRGQLINVQDLAPDVSAPAGSDPVASAPAASDPVASAPAGSDPVASAPAGSDPTGSMPMGSDPMGSMPTDTAPTDTAPPDTAPTDSAAPPTSAGG